MMLLLFSGFYEFGSGLCPKRQMLKVIIVAVTCVYYFTNVTYMLRSLGSSPIRSETVQ